LCCTFLRAGRWLRGKGVWGTRMDTDSAEVEDGIKVWDDTDRPKAVPNDSRSRDRLNCAPRGSVFIRGDPCPSVFFSNPSSAQPTVIKTPTHRPLQLSAGFALLVLEVALGQGNDRAGDFPALHPARTLPGFARGRRISDCEILGERAVPIEQDATLARGAAHFAGHLGAIIAVLAADAIADGWRRGCRYVSPGRRATGQDQRRQYTAERKNKQPHRLPPPVFIVNIQRRMRLCHGGNQVLMCHMSGLIWRMAARHRCYRPGSAMMSSKSGVALTAGPRRAVPACDIAS
jgi:hypothetical protein